MACVGSIILPVFILTRFSAGQLSGLSLISDSITNANKTLVIGVLTPLSSQNAAVPVSPFVARREIRQLHLLDEYNIVLKIQDTSCDGRMGMKAAVEMWSSDSGLDAIVGDICSTVCEPTGLLSAAWNIPQVAVKCASNIFSDKKIYPTFARMISSNENYSPAMSTLINYFGWNRVAIISATDTNSKFFATTLQAYLQKEGMEVLFYTLEIIVAENKVLEDKLVIQQRVVKDTKGHTRVYILMMYMAQIRNFLVTCYDEGMLNGDYQFVGWDTMAYPADVIVYRPELTDTFLRHGAITLTLGTSFVKELPFQLLIEKTSEIIDTGILQELYGIKTISGNLNSQQDAGTYFA